MPNATSAIIPFEPLTPHFGAIITVLSVADILARAETLFPPLQQLVHSRRLVLFRSANRPAGEGGKGGVSAAEQLGLSRIFGTIHSTFYRHPNSPHPDIFRVSNEEQQGCTQVGRSGWHNDGTFLDQPAFDYQTMYFEHASRSGFTQFLPLKEFVLSQSEERQNLWRRLWYVTRSSSSERGLNKNNNNMPIMHPLVYLHRVTGEPTMLFHLGAPFCAGYLKTATVASSVESRGCGEDGTNNNEGEECDGKKTKKSNNVRRSQLLQEAVEGGDFLSAEEINTDLQRRIDAATSPKDLLLGKKMQVYDEAAKGVVLGGDGEKGNDDADQTSNNYLVYTMKWQQHDFAIVDNAALVHFAVPSTQLPASVDGLRVLHRTTVLRR